MRKKTVCVYFVLMFLVLTSISFAESRSAKELVDAAVEYYRGHASVSVVTMTIHRPRWQRRMTIKGWTRGQKESIFTIIAPAKDKGNGTLKCGREMWTYNPRVNRVIKLPPSMMSQSWMGSDFSNNDLAKSDSILEDYTHSLTGTETHEGKTVYVVKSIPKPQAPVVWGMQILRIREDYVMLAEEFYDEDLVLVKAMTGEKIQMLGGKLFPKIWKMQKAGKNSEYTVLDYQELTFKDDLPDSIFSLSSLKKPRR